ncbi:mitochondrial 54S ribosomal protein [Saccharomycopsis crataegensis]|uniref:Large ribosomal subunit protein mL43 n=1 Tax=Saccharomycopsis crataegensis TaxID=43959 RepID=A0AAV5QLS5_9ASCO|nr:mitochondrial 54S ribosomal protein [Saccharomycopsis crataegensis]
MPVKALKATTVAINGVKSFILPCQKIKIDYCNWGGSSLGIKQYIQSKKFQKFAQDNQNIQINLHHRPGHHPVITGYYANGRTKPICVKNLDLETIDKKMDIVRSSSGEILGKYKHAVQSVNESARGIWSPLHVDPSQRHKI